MKSASAFATRARLLVAALPLGCSAFAADASFLSTAAAQASPSPYITAWRWDAARRVVGTIGADPDDAGALGFPATRVTYNDDGLITKIEKGALSAWQADTVAPSAWTGFTLQSTVEFTYDPMGNVVEQRTLGSNAAVQGVSQMSYDGDERLLCTAVRMNLSSIPAAGGNACALGTTGSFGPDRITKTEYDLASQVTATRQAVATPIEQAYATYTYTGNGKQKTLADANGNLATYEYDGFDRRVAWRFPQAASGAASATCNLGTISESGGVTGPVDARNPTDDCEKYSHDRNGNIARLVKRDGEVISYIHDTLNRMTQKRLPGGIATATCFGLAADLNDVCYNYDLRGLQLFARFGSDGGEGVSTAYDKAGRLTSSNISVGGFVRPLIYAYDANGNRTSVTHPDGQVFGYGYDGLNRMTHVYQGAGTGTYVVRYHYDDFGRRTLAYRRTGNYTSYNYDAASRLNQSIHVFAGATNIAVDTFGYNPASQIISRVRSNDGFAYVEPGNASKAYTKNGLNQYQAAGPRVLGYDLKGNLTSDAPSTGATPSNTLSYTYDAENRLTVGTGAVAATLGYDPLGRLTKAVGPSGETRLLYDGDALVAEYDAAGTLLKRYVHGAGVDEPVLEYAGSGTADVRYLHADHLGSVVARTDAGGALDAINRYDAWGVPGSTNGGRFQYTGQIMLSELAPTAGGHGLYHYKARAYAPTLGRFMQTDPIAYDDQMNLYAYVGNDGVNGRDPKGLFCVNIEFIGLEIGECKGQTQKNKSTSNRKGKFSKTKNISRFGIAAAALKVIEKSAKDFPITVYRVYDSEIRKPGSAYKFGFSWTPDDPRKMKDWRDGLAVYPAWNTGRRIVIGQVVYSDLVEGRVLPSPNAGSRAGSQEADAELGGGPYSGAAREWGIPDAKSTVRNPIDEEFEPD